MTNIEVGEVGMIPISSISLGERARQEMGDLNGMELSMKESGLITPLTVKRLEDDKYLLLAGERRFTVLSKNKVETIPARIYNRDLTKVEIKVIEKSENFWRKDLEYWEYDNLLREITELNQSIHGVKASGPGSGWSLKDTAAEMDVSDATVSTAISRSKTRELFPELFEKCKTQKDATRIISKMDEMITKDAIARKLELGKGNSKINQLSKCFILNDFFKGVKKIPDGVMHLVEIDPPYAIDLQKAKKVEGESIYTKDEYNEVDKDEYQIFLSNTFRESYRVMADHSWLICWFAPEPWFEVIYRELNAAGFDSTRMCGIWVKPSGQSKRPEMHLANSYEMFFYAWKGRPAINKAGRSNIFNYPPVPPQEKTHPTERPIDLMKDIYETFAFPGSRVFIPFLGSGVGLLAADELDMSPIGFEKGKSYRDSFLVKIYNMKGK